MAESTTLIFVSTMAIYKYISTQGIFNLWQSPGQLLELMVGVSVSEGQTNRVPWVSETRLGVVDRPVDIAMSPWSVYSNEESAAPLVEFTTSGRYVSELYTETEGKSAAAGNRSAL